MTEFDKTLIEKAQKLRRSEYLLINILIRFADTEEAVERLHNIQWELKDALNETL